MKCENKLQNNLHNMAPFVYNIKCAYIYAYTQKEKNVDIYTQHTIP